VPIHVNSDRKSSATPPRIYAKVEMTRHIDGKVSIRDGCDRIRFRFKLDQ